MIRLGRLAYANVAPFFHRLEAETQQVEGVPTALNRLLLDGSVDVTAISSIEYARHAERLVLLPRICIASDGPVGSVQLGSQLPVEEIRTIAVTPESATSVVLTNVLFPEARCVPFDEAADARLEIGDAALRSALDDPGSHHDLGRLWRERTGLPMVFALWACADPPPPGVDELEAELLASLARAEARPEELVQEASERYGFPPDVLRRYYGQLRYRLGEREQLGLRAFFEHAHGAGELESVPELRFLRESVPA